MTSQDGTLICVVGACGGCGASSLAAALAAALGDATSRCVLADLNFGGSGIEVLLGIEAEPGARWHDLAAAQGEVDGQGLIGALPQWGSVPVVSASRLATELPADDVVLDVCAGLLRAGQTVVADVPKPSGWSPAVQALLADSDYVVLLTPLTMVGSAGTQGLVSSLRRRDARPHRAAQVLLAVYQVPGGQVVAAELGELAELEVVARVGFDRGLSAAIEHGLGPRVGRRSKLGKAAHQIAAHVLVER